MKHSKLFMAVFASLACLYTASMFTGCGLQDKAIAVFEKEEDLGTSLADSSTVYYFFEDLTWELTAKSKVMLTTKEIPMYAGTYTITDGGVITSGNATIELIKTKKVEDIEVNGIVDALALAFSTPALVDVPYEEQVTKTFYSYDDYLLADSDSYKRVK